MKFYGNYQIQVPYGTKTKTIVDWMNHHVEPGKFCETWMKVGDTLIENTFKIKWLDCFDVLLTKAKEYNIQIGVHFYQEINEDTAGDWHADLGYYEDGRAYCIVREAYIEDVKWSCGKDILEDIEQIEFDEGENPF